MGECEILEAKQRYGIVLGPAERAEHLILYLWLSH